MDQLAMTETYLTEMTNRLNELLNELPLAVVPNHPQNKRKAVSDDTEPVVINFLTLNRNTGRYQSNIVEVVPPLVRENSTSEYPTTDQPLRPPPLVRQQGVPSIRQ